MRARSVAIILVGMVATVLCLWLATPYSSAQHPGSTAELITVATPGGAQVHLDDAFVGKTSSEGRLRIPNLVPGEHVIRISLEGNRDREKKLTLGAGTTTYLTYLEALKPAASARPTEAASDNAAKQAEEHLKRGNALSEDGDLNGATAEYREAVLLKPDYAEAQLSLACPNLKALCGDSFFLVKVLETPAMFEQSNDPANRSFIAHLREAARLKPDSPRTHSLRGELLEGKGDLEGAIAEFREAIPLRPDYARYHDELGYALTKKGDLDGAIAEEREFIRLEPTHLGGAPQSRRDA